MVVSDSVMSLSNLLPESDGITLMLFTIIHVKQVISHVCHSEYCSCYRSTYSPDSCTIENNMRVHYSKCYNIFSKQQNMESWYRTTFKFKDRQIPMGIMIWADKTPPLAMYLLLLVEPYIAEIKWAQNSTSGYVFTLVGGTISWKTNEETSIAVTLMKANFVVAAQAAR